VPALVQDEVSLIASITSTNLRKIVFPARFGFETKVLPSDRRLPVSTCRTIAGMGINTGWRWCFAPGMLRMTGKLVSRNCCRGLESKAE